MLLAAVPLHALAKTFGDIPDGDVCAVVLGVGSHIHLERLAVAQGLRAVQGHDEGVGGPPNGDLPGAGVIVHCGSHELGQATNRDHGALVPGLGGGGVHSVGADADGTGMDQVAVQGDEKEAFGIGQSLGGHAVGLPPVQDLVHGE